MNELELEDKIYEELLYDWDNGLKNKDIIAKYNLSVSPINLRTYIKPLILSQLCPYCGTQLQLVKRNRISPGFENPPTCPSCNHQDKLYCYCSGCLANHKEIERIEREKKKSELLAINNKIEKTVPFSSLSFNEQLWIASLVYGLSDESLNNLTSLRKSFIPIYPNTDKSIQILRNLIDKGVVSIIDFDSDFYNGDLDNINYKDLYWKLNISPAHSDLYNMIQENKLEYNYNNGNILKEDRDLLIDEVYELFEYNTNKLDFAYKPGEKTQLLIERLIGRYSYQQIVKIVHSSSTYTFRHVHEQRINKIHAYNILIHNLEGFYQKAVQGNWIIGNSYRPKECPITAYRTIIDRLKIQEMGVKAKN